MDGTSLQIWAAELKPTHTTDTDLRACSRGREKGNYTQRSRLDIGQASRTVLRAYAVAAG